MSQNSVSDSAALELLLQKDSPKIGLDLKERRYLLLCFDLVALFLSLLLSFFWAERDPRDLIGEKYYWVLTYFLTWLAVATVMQCYDIKRSSGPRSIFEAGLAAFLAGTLYQIIPLPFITPTFPSRRLYALLLPVISFAFVAFLRLIWSRIFSHAIFQRRLLVVGAGRAGETLISELNQHNAAIAKHQAEGPDASGYKVLGFVDDNDAVLDTCVHGHSVLGTHSALVPLADKLKPDEIVVAITHLDQISAPMFESIIRCRAKGYVVTTMASFYERLTSKIPLQHVGRNLQVLLPLEPDPIYRLYMVLKRGFDILSGLLGLVAIALIAPVIALLNLIYSPGPLFFRQERVGLLDRKFSVLKFRTMSVDAEKGTGAVWCGDQDPRITRHGHFMRRTRIDEIPQLLNVLVGEMTLIGPRPERPQFVEMLEREIPFYSLRHGHKPGLTGWAQVNFPYGASIEDSFQKLQYDLYYLKHQGFVLDLQIVLRTLSVVLGFKGR